MTEKEKYESLEKIYKPDKGNYTDEEIILENSRKYIHYVLEQADLSTDMMRRMFHDNIERRLNKMISEKINKEGFTLHRNEQRELKNILGSLDEPETINLFVERYLEVLRKYDKEYFLHPDRNKPVEQIIEEGAQKLTKLLIKRFVEEYEE